MHETRKPSYWAVLPAKVRYDNGLRPNAKLLYAEITALAGAQGYCWASNEHLARLFSITARTVSALLGTLAEKGYVGIEIVRDAKTNEVTERRIWIDTNPLAEEQTPMENIFHRGIEKNFVTPMEENFQENNRKNLRNTPLKSPQRGRRKQGPKKQPDWKPERFAAFWDFYSHKVRGESKQAAIRAWDRLQPDDELIGQIARALLVQLDSEDWKAGIGIPYASTYLNNRRWEDIPKASKKRPAEDSSGGWVDDPEVL